MSKPHSQDSMKRLIDDGLNIYRLEPILTVGIAPRRIRRRNPDSDNPVTSFSQRMSRSGSPRVLFAILGALRGSVPDVVAHFYPLAP
jgi:hypothetical protein